MNPTDHTTNTPSGAAGGPAIAQTVLREVRIGKVEPLSGSPWRSAINKLATTGPVAVSSVAVKGDEQGEAVIHGGPEKAVLQYAAHYYALWQTEFPASTHLLQPGGFGENFVAEGFDEGNVCISDVVEVGTVVLQVAQPRQPCFKLNHRFAQASMSRRVQDTSRTGWYYRVLRTGTIRAGDTMRITARPHPEWPVARVQHFLYQDTGNAAALATLAELPALAGGMRKVFAKRIATGGVENWAPRLVDADTANIVSLV
jgi:MOSC domain-containing protein YiiM